MTRAAGFGAAHTSASPACVGEADESPALLRVDPILGPIHDCLQLRHAIESVRTLHEGQSEIPGVRRKKIAVPGLHVWTGPPGLGKSIAAQQLEVELQAEHEAGGAQAYQARWCVAAGDVYQGGTRKMKRGISLLYRTVVDPELSDRDERSKKEGDMVNEIVALSKVDNIQMLMVDEAGTNTPAEIRGFAQVYDAALKAHHKLSIVLVGMDDLAWKVKSLGVLRSRIRSELLFGTWLAHEYLAFVIARSFAMEQAHRRQPAVCATVTQSLFQYTAGDMRQTEALLPLLDEQATPRRRLDVVAKEVMDAHAEMSAACERFAAEYETQSKRKLTRAPRKGPSRVSPDPAKAGVRWTVASTVPLARDAAAATGANDAGRGAGDAVTSGVRARSGSAAPTVSVMSSDDDEHGPEEEYNDEDDVESGDDDMGVFR